MSRTVILNSEEDTIRLAREISREISERDVIALYGELGAGKTFFAQVLCSFLDVSEYVSSPSYVIMNEYDGKFHISHLDLYRLKNEEEVLELGLEEVFENGITIIEWPESAEQLLPGNTKKFYFDRTQERRTVTIT